LAQSAEGSGFSQSQQHGHGLGPVFEGGPALDENDVLSEELP
jgi:hypothetical protein